jgi:hypothetical protein
VFACCNDRRARKLALKARTRHTRRSRCAFGDEEQVNCYQKVQMAMINDSCSSGLTHLETLGFLPYVNKVSKIKITDDYTQSDRRINNEYACEGIGEDLAPLLYASPSTTFGTAL